MKTNKIGLRGNSAVAIAVLAVLALSQVALGIETCPPNPFTGPDICVDWDQTGTPGIFDVTIDYATDPANPSVTLLKGALWQIRSKNDDDSPGNIGDVKIDATVLSDNFTLLMVAEGVEAADNVGSILLVDPDEEWTGGSSLLGGEIAGNIGDLTVVSSGSSYGQAKLTVGGNATGDIVIGEVPAGNLFKISGELSGTMDIGTVAGRLEVIGDINDNVTIDLITGEFVQLGFSLGADATITIGDLQMSGTPAECRITAYTSQSEMAGDVLLLNGVPAGQTVRVWAPPQDADISEVNLNGKDIAGELQLAHPGYLNLLNAGMVKADGGELKLGANHAPDELYGDIIIAGVEGGTEPGLITLSRTLILNGGKVRVTGDMDGTVGFASGATVDSGGEFTVDGAMDGSLTIATIGGSMTFGSVGGNVDIGTKMEGATLTVEGNVGDKATITVANMVSDGATPSAIDIQGILYNKLTLENGVPASQTVDVFNLATKSMIDLNGADVAGTLTVPAGGGGNVSDGGDVSGTVTLADGSTRTFSGTADFDSIAGSGVVRSLNGAEVTGDIEVAGDVAGSIDLADEFKGDIDIDGDIASGGLLNIGGTLFGAGRIIVDGMCEGDILIGKGTQNPSQINVIEGIGPDGSIVVNNSEGSYDAWGYIFLGNTTELGTNPMDFEGEIRIKESSSGGSGDLEGTIAVYGCHPLTYDEIHICIEGDENGSVMIVQPLCVHQVDRCCPGVDCS